MSHKITVYIVDDDEAMRTSLALLLTEEGFKVETYDSAKKFLERSEYIATGCVLLDVRMPDMDGLELQQLLPQRDIHLPVIMITGHGDVPMAVQAMKAGAKDFIEKPFRAQTLLDQLHQVLSEESTHNHYQRESCRASTRLAQLSEREQQVFERLIQGKMNKHIAAELDISIRTAEAHRAKVMKKLGAKSLADLVRLALAQRSQESIF